MGIYKTEEGKEAVRRAVGEIYGSMPFTVESRWLESEEFGKTHCLVSGNPEGIPLVLLHGTGSNSASWAGYSAEWAADFRIYALDIPGQPGLSSDERPPMEACGRWVESCVDGLGLESFCLCGMSLGGWIALRFAADRGERVRALALVTASGIVPPKGSFFLRILPLLFLGDFGAKRINRIVHGPAAVDPAAERFGMLAGRHAPPVPIDIPLFTDEELGRIGCPVLFFGGDRDALLDTAKTAERLGRLVPGAAVRVLPDTGHVILDKAGEIGTFFAEKGR